MKGREHRSKNSGDTKTTSPALYGEPDESEEDYLNEGKVGSVRSPDHSCVDREADVPFGANVAVQDGDT